MAMRDRLPLARPEMGEAELQAVRQVIESGWVTQGPMVAEFERSVAKATGAMEGVAVSSCTTALHLALIVSGIKTGDEVIVPSMSFIATANAVVHAGATPVFAEVNPVTFNLDPLDRGAASHAPDSSNPLGSSVGPTSGYRRFQQVGPGSQSRPY